MFQSCSGDTRNTQVIFNHIEKIHWSITMAMISTLDDCTITIFLQYVITLHRILMTKVLFREGAIQVKKV